MVNPKVTLKRAGSRPPSRSSQTPLIVHKSEVIEETYSKEVWSSPVGDDVFTYSSPAMTTRASSKQTQQRQRTSDYSSEGSAEESGKSYSNSIHSTTHKEAEVGSSRADSDQNGTKTGEEHPAYKEYRAAGEYWNKYPKTDYTYSKRSPHRREIADGYVALPNMSRRSLPGYADRLQSYTPIIIDQNKYSRQAFTADTSSKQNIRRRLHDYGHDVIDNTSNWAGSEAQIGLIRRWWRAVWTKILIITTWSKSWFVEVDSAVHTPYRTRMIEKTGYMSRFTSWVSRSIIWLMSSLYRVISTLLLLDSVVARRRESPPRPSTRALLLLLLMPLLLLGAWWLLEQILSLLTSDNLTSVVSGTSSLMLAIPNFLIGLVQYVPAVPYISSQEKQYVENLHYSPETISSQKVDRSKHNSQSKVNVDETLNNNVKIYIQNILNSHDFSNNLILTPEITEQITKLVQDNIREFSDEEMRRISDLIKHDIELGIKDKIDVSTLVNQVVESVQLKKKLKESFDAGPVVKEHQNIIDRLTIDIVEIKRQLNQKDGFTDNLQNDIASLKLKQDELTDQIKKLQATTAENLDLMSRNMESRIDEQRRGHYNKLDLHVKKLLAEVFGYEQEPGSTFDLKSWVESVFVAKDTLEKRLAELNIDLKSYKADLVLEHVSREIKNEFVKFNSKQSVILANIKNDGKKNRVHSTIVGQSNIDVEGIIKEALAVYDADKIGIPDYALESGGGQVLSTRCTESYNSRTAQYVVLGLPLWWYVTNSPRTAITPSVAAGQCWAFQGFPGYLVIQLSMPIQVTGFTVEHVARNLVAHENIDSAPKNFSVWGLRSERDNDPITFGQYTYLDNSTALQYFDVQTNEHNQKLFNIVELRIESNHGNPVFTCLYRFRVHGNPT